MGRVLGIDYGRKQIGLALSDETNMLASPLETLVTKHPRAAITQLAKLIDEHHVTHVVVGLPLDQDGEAAALADEIKAWVRSLSKATPATFKFQDERFTSQWADQIIARAKPGQARKKQRKQRDAIAAQAILQDYLDAQRSTT